MVRLSGELERANSELTNSLDENTRVRRFLAQILGGLPCGVLVIYASAMLCVINPEARRLLLLDPSWLPEQGVALPAVIDRLLAESSSKSPAAELEWSFDDPAGTRFLGIAWAQVAGKNDADGETIWVLRDMTQEKRIFSEQEKSRRNEALAPVCRRGFQGSLYRTRPHRSAKDRRTPHPRKHFLSAFDRRNFHRCPGGYARPRSH